MTEHTRINLDEATESRAPIDANWSPRKKAIVGAVTAIVAVSAVSGGVWWTISNQPPRMPRSADEAITILASSQFDRLDEERQRQYAAEAGRLLRDLSPEDRRAMFEDEANREALRKIREDRFDEIVRRFARGEEMERGPWQRGERPPRPEGEERRPPFNPENISPEDRERMREQIRERINEQIMTAAQSGNAQSSGLRAEMMKRRAESGGQRGGGGGGGPRGG